MDDAETRSCEDFPEVANLTDSEIKLEVERYEGHNFCYIIHNYIYLRILNFLVSHRYLSTGLIFSLIRSHDKKYEPKTLFCIQGCTINYMYHEHRHYVDNTKRVKPTKKKLQRAAVAKLGTIYIKAPSSAVLIFHCWCGKCKSTPIWPVKSIPVQSDQWRYTSDIWNTPIYQ